MSTRFLIGADHHVLRIRPETAGRALTIMHIYIYIKCYTQPQLQLIYTQKNVLYMTGQSVGNEYTCIMSIYNIYVRLRVSYTLRYIGISIRIVSFFFLLEDFCGTRYVLTRIWMFQNPPKNTFQRQSSIACSI